MHINQEGLARGINPIASGSALHTQVMKTEALKQALDRHGFDAAFGGARRDEEKSRAKERIFSFRTASHAWDPRNQRPELWRLFNTRIGQGEIDARLPAVELDRARRLALHPGRGDPGRAALFRQAERPVVQRDGTLIMVDDERLPLEPGEVPQMRMVRFRTLGCYPLTGAIESDADDARGDRRRDAAGAHLGAPGPPDRRRRERPRWRRRSARAISDDGVAAGAMASIRADAGRKALLRFLTCGSVDDGKSTLIGRLLYDTEPDPDDQLAAPLENDSSRHGTTGDDIDFALLLDGLEAEREQGITIDVAYRFFSTAKRSFIVADTPGHEQYTRNMATGASNADLAVLLVDARKGVLTQTRRHAAICSLLGIRHVVLAVNKIDLVGFDQAVLRRDRRRFRALSPRRSAFARDHADPALGALSATMSPAAAPRCPGISGPTLLEHSGDASTSPRTWPTSRSASRCNGSTGPISISAAFAGTVASRPRRGRAMRSSSPAPAGQSQSSRASSRCDGDLREAAAGDAVTLTLADEIDVPRGDMLAPPDAPPGGRRPVRRPSGLDGGGAAAARPLLSAASIGTAHRAGHRHRASSTRSTSNTLEQLAGRDAGAQRDRRSCNISTASAGRLRSLCRRTATPAASS